MSLEGTDEAIDKALKELESVFYHPEQAFALKQEQLKKLAEMNGEAPPSSSSMQMSYNAEAIFGAGYRQDSQHMGGGSGGGVASSGGIEGFHIELRVPNPMVGLVIGKGGRTSRRCNRPLECMYR